MTARPMLVAFVGLLSTGCLSSRTAGSRAQQADGRTFGSFKVASAPLGNPNLTVTSCQSGGRLSFVGADLFDDTARMAIRLVIDPLYGPGVRVFSLDAPFDKTVVFTRGECKAFHFALDSSGWRVNDVTEYHVTLEIDCSRPNGESLAGQATIRNCS
jgi:hypothetical protein